MASGGAREHELVLDASGGCWYRLFGVVAHTGGLSSGHYVAYTYNAVLGEWRHFSDTRSNASSATAVRRASAYMLMYERCMEPPSPGVIAAEQARDKNT